MVNEVSNQARWLFSRLMPPLLTSIAKNWVAPEFQGKFSP
jgi:hypothetical protein